MHVKDCHSIYVEFDVNDELTRSGTLNRELRNLKKVGRQVRMSFVNSQRVQRNICRPRIHFEINIVKYSGNIV